MDTAVKVIIAVVVVLLLIAAAVAIARRASTKRQEHHRERAGELRGLAAATHEGIRRQEAEADAAEALAKEVRAEADRRVAEAELLKADARDKRSTISEHEQRRDEALHEADKIDPDIDAESSESSGSSGSSDPASGEHRA